MGQSVFDELLIDIILTSNLYVCMIGVSKVECLFSFSCYSLIKWRLKANSHECTISICRKFLIYLKAISVRENSIWNHVITWGHHSQQAVFFYSGKRVNVDFHITPCTHGACELISNVVNNEHLRCYSSSHWTFSRADRQVKLRLNSVWSDADVSLHHRAAVKSHEIRLMRMCVCMWLCVLARCTQVCSCACVWGSSSHWETTLVWKAQRAHYLSHTRVGADIQLCLPSISLIELGLWEIMILITHKLKGQQTLCYVLLFSLALLPHFLLLIFQWPNVSYYCVPSPFLAFQSIDCPYFDLKK